MAAVAQGLEVRNPATLERVGEVPRTRRVRRRGFAEIARRYARRS